VRNEDGAVRLSVVVPAFNESGRLPGSLEAILAHLEPRSGWLPAEIIVVDDGSSDGTAAVVDRIRPRTGIVLRALQHERNRGKGAAARTGFAASSGHRVLLTDADLAAPIEGLETLAAAAPDSVAIASRAVDRGLIVSRQPAYRDLMGRTFNLVVRALLLGGIRDTQCGFKLFPGQLARRLAACQRLDGFAFDVELLVLARRWGFEVLEVAVPWRHVEASRVQPVRHSAQMLRDVLRVAWWRARGRLPGPPDLPEPPMVPEGPSGGG
jgi:dolichyl-phosphate beta-glucosyltransferase